MSRAAALALLLLVASGPAAAEGYKPPRAPDGRPSLEGVWTNRSLTTLERRPIFKTLAIPAAEATAFEAGADGRPPLTDDVGQKETEWWEPGAALARIGGEARSSWIVDPADGRIPRRTDAAPRRRAGGVSTNANPRGPFNSWLDMGLYDRCITRGIPASMMPAGYGSRYDLTQSPDSVVIRYEMIHEARVIPLDGRPRATGPRTYLGDARGWWEGNTLVVETTNFRAETAPQGGSEQVIMTERFVPISSGVVEWRVTFEDPSVWTRPWTYAMPLTKVDHSQQVYEYACHEGNHAMRNILSAARAEDKK